MSANLLDLATSPIISTLSGGLFAFAGGILDFFKQREAHKAKMAERTLEMEVLKLQGNIDQARLAGMLTMYREKNEGEAFTASQQAEANLRSGARWSATLRESTRPLLTWFYQFLTLAIAGTLLLGHALDTVSNPVLQYLIIMSVNTASMTVSWWFGQRQIEKQVSWGNATNNAKLTRS